MKLPIQTLLIAAVFLSAGLVPFSAEASTPRPSCNLTLTTDTGSLEVSKTGDAIVLDGENVTVSWEANNATAARFNGGTVALSGSQSHLPVLTTTYIFEASNGSRKATCKITVHLVGGSIDTVSKGTRPTLTGTASESKKVSVAIYKKGSDMSVFEKKNITVKNGTWSIRTSKDLAQGDYDVRLSGDTKYKLNTITASALTIGDTNTLSGSNSSKGILSVTTVPLLGGGTTRAGASVPIVYLQLRNTGSEAVHITGFDVKQNGTASTNGILTLSTVDDKGGSRGASAMNPFSNNMAIAPTDATIAPGAVKLFTIKANLGSNVSVGTNLMLDITGVESNGSEMGAFPLRGVTWVIGN